MRESIDIIIREEGVRFTLPRRKGLADEFLPAPVNGLADRLRRFVATNGLKGLPVNFFVAEDLLFFKQLTMPLQTADIKEAISLQLDMLLPFASDEVFYSFTSHRGKENYQINLYALESEKVGAHIQELADAGFRLEGLFPESQRYVAALASKDEWTLVLGNQMAKVLVFAGSRLLGRTPCYHAPRPEDLGGEKDGGRVYWSEPPPDSAESAAAGLLAGRPLLRDFNLLPSSYRRPDYLRYLIMALCCLNIMALLALGVSREYSLQKQADQFDGRIVEILPAVKEADRLQGQSKELAESLEGLKKIGVNFDLLDFLARTTSALPDNSYLDQIRLEHRGGPIHLQGYSDDDISSLTEKLETLGKVKLRSTRRRKNKTYFQVEITPS